MRLSQKEPKPKISRKVRQSVIGIMVGITLLILGGLSLPLLTSSPPHNPTNGTVVTLFNGANNPASRTTSKVGPPGHELDLAYPLAAVISMEGADIPTPDPSEQVALPQPRLTGAFATTDTLAQIESYYSQKLKAAGYAWDWEDACGPDSRTKCPQRRYFTGDIYACSTAGAPTPGQDCDATYQINLWLLGAQAGPAEIKILNIPQSILDQLKPGQTLIGYQAGPLYQPTPNLNVTKAVTTAALVPTPTSGPISTPVIPQTRLFVGPDNAFHYSQYDDNPDKQATFGASLVATGPFNPVAIGSDGTFQLNWLVSEEGQKTSLQARIVTPHNTAFTASQLFNNFGFAYLSSDGERNKIPVNLVDSKPVEGTPNTFIWTMQAQPLPAGKRSFTFNFEPTSGIGLVLPIQLQLNTYQEAGLPHPVALHPQYPGGQASGMWLKPLQAYFGSDRTILSLAFQPDVYRDKEAYYLLPQLLSQGYLKVTDDKGRILAPLDPSQQTNLNSLAFQAVTPDAKSLKIELTKMVVGRNLNQPTTTLENAPVTRLEVPIAELLKRGQTLIGPVLKTPGINNFSVEGMSSILDRSQKWVTLTLRYRVGESIAYPPALEARSVGFSCEKCGQGSMERPVSSRILTDGSIEFSLTYKYDAAQTNADLKVVSEQFWLPGPWRFEINVTR